MRKEQEMFELIMNFANKDERVRAVILNGSRANPNATKDKYQDYDIVYVVEKLEQFKSDYKWLDVFGERLIMQTPQTMRNPDKGDHFTWLMLFNDGNRIDLTLIPLDKIEFLQKDSLTRVLLDKDKIIAPLPPSGDKDYLIEKPNELFYYSCCNNFFWCMQNVAKAIARDELAYAMTMFHCIVREELHEMICWYIGIHNNFSVSAGKMGRNFKKYLPDRLFEQYSKTYSTADYDNFWNAAFVSCDLFRFLAQHVANFFGYNYNDKDDNGIIKYMNMVKSDSL